MGMMLVCMERICDILLAKQIIDGEIPLLRVRADAAFQKISNPYVRSLILFLELAYGYEYTDFEGDSRTNFESHTLRNTKEGCKIKQIELIFDKTDNTIAFIDMDDEPQKKHCIHKIRRSNYKRQSNNIQSFYGKGQTDHFNHDWGFDWK